jgi:hypothetical protein
MARDHFAQYKKKQPQEYAVFSNAMWDSFVSVTKVVGLGKFFSFTPEKLDIKDYDPDLTGAALGEIYNFSQGIDNTPDL